MTASYESDKIWRTRATISIKAEAVEKDAYDVHSLANVRGEVSISGDNAESLAGQLRNLGLELLRQANEQLTGHLYPDRHRGLRNDEIAALVNGGEEGV